MIHTELCNCHGIAFAKAAVRAEEGSISRRNLLGDFAAPVTVWFADLKSVTEPKSRWKGAEHVIIAFFGALLDCHRSLLFLDRGSLPHIGDVSWKFQLSAPIP